MLKESTRIVDPNPSFRIRHTTEPPKSLSFRYIKLADKPTDTHTHAHKLTRLLTITIA